MEALDLTALTAAEIVARVHDGRSSAADVARAHLARIAERDPSVGAFQAHDPQRVLAEAGGVDARPDRFALPLAGVPVAVTDSVHVAGYPTRHGSAATSPEPARRDDELVKRLRGAGAVVIGKTRMSELALDPGGAADGSAAAVAAGMAVLGLGTDGGGGIRIPAAYRGLVGIAPGTGVVPLPGGAQEHWCGFTATGSIARTAGDAALMLRVLSGQGEGDSADSHGADIDGRPARIALSLRNPSPVGRLHDDHRAAAVGAAARFRAGPRGAAVILADPPYPRDLTVRWTRRRQAGVAAELAELGLDAREVERRTAAVARRGRRVLRHRPPRPEEASAWRERFLTWLDASGYDLLLSPATAGPPVLAGVRRGRRYLPTALVAATRVPYTQAWSLAGLPAVVAPVIVRGVPVGVQLVGRPGDEQKLLAAAARLEGRVVPALASAGSSRAR